MTHFANRTKHVAAVVHTREYLRSLGVVCGPSLYVAVKRPSVCLSHRSTVAAAAGGFAAERPAAAGDVQQVPALSGKCGQRHIDSQRRRLNTVVIEKLVDLALFSIVVVNFTRECGIIVYFLWLK